jgi:hypothetical protein
MLKNTAAIFALTLATGLTASADFSYTSTTKATGGSMAAMAGTAADRTSKLYFKGQKLMTSTGDTAILIDFDAQTVTTINNAQKTYTVKKFGDLASTNAIGDVTFDVKDTGEKKVVNGFNASETIVSMGVDMEMGRGAPAMKMQVEMDMWISPDVPGSGEMRSFYKRNAANFPWASMMGSGGNAGIQKAMAQMQRKLAEMDGVVVEQIIRVKPAGGSAAPQMAQMPQMTPAQQAQMQAAMAKMQAMSQQGGPQAAAAQQAMAAMGGMGRAGAAGGGGGSPSLIELTMDSNGFSGANVPDSVFAIPEGYKQTQ